MSHLIKIYTVCPLVFGLLAKHYVLLVIVSPLFTFYLYCRGRAVTNAGRTCSPTPLHIYMAIN